MQYEVMVACFFYIVHSLRTRVMALSSQASSLRLTMPGVREEVKGLPLTMADVREAERRVRGHVHQTPVMTSCQLDSVSGHNLFFKCEMFQKAGSFKVVT